LAEDRRLPGAGADGISEEFPLDGARTLYGASKLAAELLVTEYAASHGEHRWSTALRSSPGRGDGQGRPGRLHALVLSFYFGRALTYIG